MRSDLVPWSSRRDAKRLKDGAGHTSLSMRRLYLPEVLRALIIVYDAYNYYFPINESSLRYEYLTKNMTGLLQINEFDSFLEMNRK